MDDDGPFEDPYICPGCGKEIVPGEPFDLAHELIEIRGFGLGKQEPGTGEIIRFHPGHFEEWIGRQRYRLIERE